MNAGWISFLGENEMRPLVSHQEAQENSLNLLSSAL